MFDAASRYLLFPMKRAVADVLLPQLEMVSPAELCNWLVLSEMYAPHLPLLFPSILFFCFHVMGGVIPLCFISGSTTRGFRVRPQLPFPLPHIKCSMNR